MYNAIEISNNLFYVVMEQILSLLVIILLSRVAWETIKFPYFSKIDIIERINKRAQSALSEKSKGTYYGNKKIIDFLIKLIMFIRGLMVMAAIMIAVMVLLNK